MRVIPCDPGLERIFLGFRPHQRDGVAVLNDEDDPVMIVSVLNMPEGERMEVFEVKVPSRGIPKQLAAQTPVRFQELIARHWAIDGRSGVSFSCAALVQARGKASSE